MVEYTSSSWHDLTHHPVRAFLLSWIFIVDGFFLYWLAAGIGAFVLSARIIGAMRTIVVAATGHISATVITQAAGAILVHYGRLPTSHISSLDVGPSYVVVTLLSFAAAISSGRDRVICLLAVAPVAIYMLINIVDWDTASSGHVICGLEGCAFAYWYRTHPVSTSGAYTEAAHR